MPIVQSGDARIHWEAQGSGTPVLLIMGHLYSSAMWYPLLPALTRRHRAITFDNRGTGDSDTTRTATIGQFADDALAVLDAAGVQKAHVFGVSMGGGIAAEFAMRYPDRVTSLVLGCTRMKMVVEARPLAAQIMYRLPLGLVRTMLKGRMDPGAYGSAAPADAVAKDMQILIADRFTMTGVRVQGEAIANYTTTPEQVARLTMPTLVLHGDEDRAVDVKYGREFAAAIPGARLTIFPGAGHNFLVAATEASTKAVLDFFDEVDRAALGRTA
ncbi:MAG TPA: alpha/beta fold hydrolase [Caulobacteraceae bacterium]|jgi:pimeloyl-ACP methyl ester carboxylesterase